MNRCAGNRLVGIAGGAAKRQGFLAIALRQDGKRLENSCVCRQLVCVVDSSGSVALTCRTDEQIGTSSVAIASRNDDI